MLTLLADHPLQFTPKDKARYFSVSGDFAWGNDAEDYESHGFVDAAFHNLQRNGENGRLSIRRYTTLSKSETAVVVNISINKGEKILDNGHALKLKLKIADDGPGYLIIKVDDHIKTDEFDFVVRRIIPPDGKGNLGWIDLELLTGAK